MPPAFANSLFPAEKRGGAELLRTDNCIILTTPHPARLAGLKWKQRVLPAFLREAIAAVRAEINALPE